MQTADDKKKKRRLPHIEMTQTNLKLYGCATMLFYTISVSLIQQGLVHVGRYTSESFAAALAANPELMMMSSWASLFQLIGGLAVPVFAFLLVEGFQNTRSYARYLLTMLLFAAISEAPYDLATTGRWVDWSGQNALFTLSLCLVMLYGLRLCARPGLAYRVAQACVVLAAAFWSVVLRCGFGLCTVLLVAVYYLFYERKGVRVLLGCAISLMYVTGPISAYPLWSYGGEKGRRINKYWFYLFYPAHLLALGLLAQAIA